MQQFFLQSSRKLEIPLASRLASLAALETIENLYLGGIHAFFGFICIPVSLFLGKGIGIGMYFMYLGPGFLGNLRWVTTGEWMTFTNI